MVASASLRELASLYRTVTTLLFFAGALCRMMALHGGTEETVVERTGSFKVGILFGRSIQPQALAKCLEHTRV